MMLKRYILTSLLALTTAAAFSFGSAADANAGNQNDRIRKDFYRPNNDHGRQVVNQVVPPNGNGNNNNGNTNNGTHAVPEPATMLLIGSAIGGLAIVGRRKNRE